MGRGHTAITDAPLPPGNPLQPCGSAPFLLPLPASGAAMGEGTAGRTWGRGGGAQGLEAPTLGEESWAAVGGGGSGRAGAPGRRGARSPAGPPARAPGWAAEARRGLGSARGSGHWAQAQLPRGRDPRIPRAPPPSRLRRSARAPGLGGRRGLGLGAGSGAGPAWARPGAWGPGLAPPQSDAPRTPHVALRPLRG